MNSDANSSTVGQTRRVFLKKAAVATAFTGTLGGLPAWGRNRLPTISIVNNLREPGLRHTPVEWAIEELRGALETRGVSAVVRQSRQDAPSGERCIEVLDASSKRLLESGLKANNTATDYSEAFGFFPGREEGRTTLLVFGSGTRGLVYALLELADRARFAADPLADFDSIKRIVQKPANRVRSIARLFASEVEDKSWFNDRAFWRSYLTELATHRFNRFALTLGLGYDFPTDIRDAYLHFAYPFLISVPGYDVRADPLPPEERDRNLEQLKFISEETARRGLHFQLGLWTHAYEWVDSPKANYLIKGLTRETHAPYCRDALTALLRACPAISGVTFRIHGESGIAEGSYDFWKTVFHGVVKCGRRVDIDMHAKGMDDKMIELALATGLPISISPKFWAEHQGLGYMQGAIRPQEMPPRENRDNGFFSRSNGSRRFLRYGYGDLLAENRRYDVIHRIWPGTQRLLLMGDPELAANYGRASSFCGSAGVEWCEPLSFKGRKGSGLPGGRSPYADETFRPRRGDFEKYSYSYRVWGRRVYDPDCEPDQWRRWLRKQFGAGSTHAETALSNASRILPLLTTAHCPSAANNNYWPEMYTNMAIVDAKRPHPYGDTLSPKRFGTVSPLDPEFFSRVDDFAEELLKSEASGKYSPAWVAAELEALAQKAGAEFAAAKPKLSRPQSPEFRRWAADIEIQSGLGMFFAGKLRGATLFGVYERTGDRTALEAGLQCYREARAAWAKMAEAARPIYRSDITFGPGNFQRGHWLDRLPAIDADIADMEKQLQRRDLKGQSPGQKSRVDIANVINAILHPPATKRSASLVHTPPQSFRRGEPLSIQGITRGDVKEVRLRFRRVNQAETWQSKVITVASGGKCSTIIPAVYTDSPFPLQYHFELRDRRGDAELYPGLKPGWKGQPYFVVERA
jgi:hypothetical protein